MSLFNNEKRDMSGTPNSRGDVVLSSRHVGDVHTLLGKGSEFKGKLSFEGQVRIDGTFNGEISTSDTLIVGDGAVVEADIKVGTLLVYGTLQGTVKASVAVELHPPARVTGTLDTPALSIAKGVLFEGTTHMAMPEQTPSLKA